MATLQLTRVGEDSWSRPTYQDENGNFYKDVNMLPLWVTPQELCVSSPRDDFDGEPDYPVTDFVILNPPTEKEIRMSQFRNQYGLLSRLQMDCKYFLGNGGRCERHLWAGNVTDQIAKMKELWQSFPDDLKPEWLTWEQILDYEQKMN